MSFKVSEKVTNLVQQLFEEGYNGVVEFTNDYCTGTYNVLENSFSLKLSGFCKESLHICEDNSQGDIWFVGRYDLEKTSDNPTVETVVDIAWLAYRFYKDRGYSLPDEFKELFVKYGYLTKKTITKDVWEEN